MRQLLVLSLIAAGGCRRASAATSYARTTVSGQVQFRDSDVDASGSTREVSRPSGTGTLHITIRGIGKTYTSDRFCNDQDAYQWTASYSGPMEIDSSGSYEADITTDSFTTVGGCAISDADVGQVTDIQISAELPVSGEGCNDMCASRGRSIGEYNCAVAPDRESCRPPIAEAVARSCVNACYQHATTLWGHGFLVGGTVLSLDASDIELGDLGYLRADIVFGQMADRSNQYLQYAPPFPSY